MMKTDVFMKRGSVTIFISLILCTLMIFVEVVAEYYKSYAASSIVENSMRLTAYTGTADFDRTLMDTYGLLKMSNNIDELNENLGEYFANSINAAGIEFNGDNSPDFISSAGDIENNILEMNVDYFSVSGVKGSELYNCDVLKKQIVEYSKYRAPVMLSEEFLKKIKIFNSIEETKNVVKSKNEYDAALSEIQIKFVEIYKSEEKIINFKEELSFENFEDLLHNIRNGGNANSSLDEIDSYNLFVCENELFEKKPPENFNVIGIGYFNSNVYDSMNTLHASNIRDYAMSLKYNEKFIATTYENYIEVVNQREKIEEELGNLYAKKIECSDKNENSENENAAEIAINELIEEKFNDLQSLNDIICKFSDIENIYNDLYLLAKEVKSEYIKNMLEINSFLIEEYKLVDDISCELENMSGLLILLRDEILEKIDSKLEKYDESVEKLDDGSIKHAFKTDVDEKFDYIDIEEINALIKIINENKEYFNQYKANMGKMTYRDQNICCERYIYSSKLSRIDEVEYCYNVEIENLVNYSNIYENCFASQEYYKNLGKVKSSEFYKYIEKHIKLSKNIDEELECDVENINELVSLNYANEKDEENVNIFIPAEGVVYDDLATTLYYEKSLTDDNEISDETVVDGNIENMTIDESNIEHSKDTSLEQVEYLNSNIGNTFNGFDFKENEDGNLKNMRNELYILSYINEKFNNQVCEFDGLHYTDCEMEYLLYGTKGNACFSNKGKADSSIFATRYLLNTVYAYTDSEIKSYTLSLAVSIAGFTGFGIPVVQNAFILMLAFAETILDMKNLLNGNDVVVYKSITTWKFKPSNLTRELVDEVARDVVSKGLESMNKTVNEYFEDKSEEALDKMLNSLDSMSDVVINTTIESVVSSLLAPIESKLITFGEATDNVNLRDEYINILEYLETGNDAYDEILEFASSYILNDRIDEIDSKMDELGAINEDSISEYIENLVDDEKGKLILKLKHEYIGKMKDKMRKEILECESKGIDFVNDRIEEYFDEFNFSYVRDGDSNNENCSLERSSFVTMNYTEYLNLFLLAKILGGGEDDILLRIADIIKVNFTMCDESENKAFKLRDSYTLIEINVKVDSDLKDFVKKNYFLKDDIDWKLVYGY